MDFEALFLYLVQSGLGAREDSQLGFSSGVMQAIEELAKNTALETRNYFSACQDKMIETLGQIFTGTKGIKSLDQSQRYGVSPVKPAGKNVTGMSNDKENLTRDQLKEAEINQSRKKKCVRKFKQAIDFVVNWKNAAWQFDGIFRSYDGIRRNFEQLNQYLASSAQSMDLQK